MKCSKSICYIIYYVFTEEIVSLFVIILALRYIAKQRFPSQTSVPSNKIVETVCNTISDGYNASFVRYKWSGDPFVKIKRMDQFMIEDAKGGMEKERYISGKS